MAAGIAAAFVLGYKIATIAALEPNGVGGSDGKSVVDVEEGLGGNGKSNVVSGTTWQEVKERVVKRWKASPAVCVDFELREETLRLLDRVSAADLETWMRDLRPEGDMDGDRNIPLQLRELILIELAPRCGGSLIRSLAEHPLVAGWNDLYLDLAMEHWIKSDPSSVLDWLDGDVPEEIRKDLQDFQEDALELLAGKDPAEFEKRLSKVDSEIREDVLQDYAYRRGTAEDRAGILERAAESPHDEAMALWRGLLQRESSSGPLLAYATLKALDVSADDQAALDESLVSRMLYCAAGAERCEIMQAWMERNPGKSVPERLLDALVDQGRPDFGQASTWFVEQPDERRHDDFAKLLIERVAGGHEVIAKIVDHTGDLPLRAAMLRQLKASWQLEDSAAAMQWERLLSDSDRERLK